MKLNNFSIRLYIIKLYWLNIGIFLTAFFINSSLIFIFLILGMYIIQKYLSSILKYKCMYEYEEIGDY